MTTPYKKAVNKAGDTVALVHHEAERVIILYPVKRTNAEGYDVDVRQCSSMDEAVDKFLGTHNLEDATVDEYNDTLFTTWGFSGSNIYQATTEGEQNVAHLRSENISTESGNDQGETGSVTTSDIPADPALEVEGQGGTTGIADEGNTDGSAVDQPGISDVGNGTTNDGDEPELDVRTNDADPPPAGEFGIKE